MYIARMRRIISTVAGIGAIAVLLAAWSSVALAEQNQSGPTVSEQLIGACRATGGIEDVWVERTGAGWQFTVITCRGGALDGLQCKEAPGLSPWCSFTFTQPIETLDVVPAEGIELVEREPITALPPAGGVDRPTVAEDPTSGATVIANQVGHPVIDNALAQANACRALGGDAHFGEDWSVPGDPWVVITCTGGLLDGLWCHNDPGRTVCQVLRSLEPQVAAAVTPVDRMEQPDEQATVEAVPATEPTAMPAEPTVAPSPTETPVEPTVAPTQAPLNPKVEGGPPSGPLDPNPDAPTPTPVVLT